MGIEETEPKGGFWVAGGIEHESTEQQKSAE